LLLERLCEFIFQFRGGFADAADVSSRLRCLRTKTGNLSSALRPFARQGHLVGTVGGSIRSAQPRIGPITPNKTARGTRAASLDPLVGAGEQRGRHFEAERLGSLKVEHQLVFSRRLHRQIGGLLALEYSIDIGGGAPVLVEKIRPIG